METLDIAIVGAGVSGLYLIHRLRADGWRVRAFEAGTDIGGTWYWNRYPGLRCDVESQQYSYSFSDALQKEWHWSERYAPRAEIHRYLSHVADRFDLRRDIVFNTRVTGAAWDDAAGLWRIERTPGEPVSARYLIMASGALSRTNLPDIPGIRDFAGPIYHTGQWPKEDVDFTGLDVGVIGTGSSAIQSIPIIAKQAKSLTVFQRTANFVVPAWNKPLDPAIEADFKANHEKYREILRSSPSGYFIDVDPEPMMSQPREQVLATLERRYLIGGLSITQTFADVRTDRRANDIMADFMRDKIRSRVRDKVLAEKLVPRGYPYATKRLCVDTDYLETYNQPHVRLVDLKETPIERADGAGIVTSERRFDFDAIVSATGFDAVTGALLAVDLKGRGGVTLRDRWQHGPSTYLGLQVAGFPNMFTVTGPQSPSILSSVIVSIEQHVDMISGLLGHMRKRGVSVIEAEPAAETAWGERCAELVAGTFYAEANSWYMGANVPGKPRVMLPFVGGVGVYRDICREIFARGTRGSGWRRDSATTVNRLRHISLNVCGWRARDFFWQRMRMPHGYRRQVSGRSRVPVRCHRRRLWLRRGRGGLPPRAHGLAVAVLEQGRHVAARRFSDHGKARRKTTRLTGRAPKLGDPAGLYYLSVGKGLTVFGASGLGGGSLINAGVALRPDLGRLRKAGWPDAVRRRWTAR